MSSGGFAFTGGGNDLSIIGNTAGTAALVSTGTLYLAGGNNVTLSQNGNSVTISANTAAAATLSVSAGSTSGAFGGITLANSNNITFGLNNGTITASVSSQSVQTQPAGNIAGTGFATTTSAGTAVGGTHATNGLTLGMPPFITTYVAQTTQTQPAGNIAGVGTTTTTQAGSTLGATLGTNGLSLAVPPWVTAGGTGGGIDVSAGGNTAGTLALVSTGTLLLAGGNNVTLSQNANTLTISAANQSNQTEGLYALGNTTGQSSSSTFDARSMSISGAGGVSVGYSGSALVISGGAGSSQTEAIYIAGNTTGQSSQSTYTVGSLNISASGVVSAGWSSNTLIISAPGTTGLTQLSAGISSGGNTAGTTGLASAQLVLAGGNNITLSGSTSGGSMTVTVSAGASGGGFTGGVSTGGNTSGNTGTQTGQFVLAGGNNITLSVGTAAGGAQTITISGANAGGAQTGISGVIVSNTTYTSGTVSFSNANGISFGSSAGQAITASYTVPTVATTAAYYFIGNTTGQSSSSTGNDQSISISAAGLLSAGWSSNSIVLSAVQSNQSMGLYGVGNTTQNSSTTLDARTVSFDGLGAMTVGFSNGSVQLSAPAVSTLSGTGAVAISTNGSTISIGVPTIGTLSYYDNGLLNGSATVTQNGVGSVVLQPIGVSQYLSISALREFVSGSFSSSSNSSYAQTLSFQAAIYTRNGSSLSLASSGSQSYAFTNTSNNSFSVLTGIKGITVPLAASMTPGNYWLGVWSSTASANANWATISNVVANEGALTYNGAFGSATNGTNQVALGGGLWSTTSAALPASIGLSQISGSIGNIAPYFNLYNVSA